MPAPFTSTSGRSLLSAAFAMVRTASQASAVAATRPAIRAQAMKVWSSAQPAIRLRYCSPHEAKL